MYICHVSDVHQPNFLIVESLYPMILSAMVPPVRRKCAPIISGAMPLSCRLSDFATVHVAATISEPSMECHMVLMHTSQMRCSPLPQALKRKSGALVERLRPLHLSILLILGTVFVLCVHSFCSKFSLCTSLLLRAGLMVNHVEGFGHSSKT